MTILLFNFELCGLNRATAGWLMDFVLIRDGLHLSSLLVLAVEIKVVWLVQSQQSLDCLVFFPF